MAMDIHTHIVKYSGNDISARPNCWAQGNGYDTNSEILSYPYPFYFCHLNMICWPL